MQARPSIFAQNALSTAELHEHHYGTTVDLESLSSRASLSNHQWIRFIFWAPQGLAPLNNYFFFFSLPMLCLFKAMSAIGRK